MLNRLKKQVEAYDERWEITIPGNASATQHFCVEHFLNTAQEAITRQGYFAVALSGGSTPQAIYQELALPQNRQRIDWEKVLLFWSDERAVAPNHPDNNYHMAMQAGFSHLPILTKNIFRMPAENILEDSAPAYEELIKTKIPSGVFDLVMLGMGGDGHTASLFPHTKALHIEDKLVVMNYIPQKNTWRMTLTYQCINQAHHIVVYVLGDSKANTLRSVFRSPYDPETYPIQRIGLSSNKALWIMDRAAAYPFFFS